MERSNIGPIVMGEVVPAPEALRRHTGDWVVTVTCPYCQQPHTHAAPNGPGFAPGFRIAHCRLDRQGYVIVPVKNQCGPRTVER